MTQGQMVAIGLRPWLGGDGVVGGKIASQPPEPRYCHALGNKWATATNHLPGDTYSSLLNPTLPP